MHTYNSAIIGNNVQQYAQFYMFWHGMNALMEEDEMDIYKVWTSVLED